MFVFFKQKTSYEMRISDWSADVCSSDLRAGMVDNDWIEACNVNGTLTARAVVSQRIPEGMTLMDHAQEKIVNVPGAEMRSGERRVGKACVSTCRCRWDA